VIILVQLLGVVTVLMFVASALTYAFNRHLGTDLFKRSLLLLVVLAVGPNLIRSVFAEIPTPVLILLIPLASLVAYWLLETRAKPIRHRSGSSVSHAERKPKIPHQGQSEDGES